MASASRVDFNVSRLKAAADRISTFEKKRAQIVQRSAVTLSRRLKPEAARIIARDVLNLPAGKISKNISAQVRNVGSLGKIVSLTASRVRLPLSDYKPRVSRRGGVTVTTWLDADAQVLPHAFKRRDANGIWQRIPAKNGNKAAPSGLVQRLPIVQRKGPSMSRVFQFTGARASHVDIRPDLNAFAEKTLSAEVARLLGTG